MELICGGWVAVVVLFLIGRAAWKTSQRIADWKPSQRPPAPPPEPEMEPEPTPEELAADARERYEARLRWLDAAGLDEIELEAARMKAKQKYLKELDGIL